MTLRYRSPRPFTSVPGSKKTMRICEKCLVISLRLKLEEVEQGVVMVKLTHLMKTILEKGFRCLKNR